MHIPGEFEVVGAFGWPELFQDDCEGVADCVEGSRGGTSEQRLELGITVTVH